MGPEYEGPVKVHRMAEGVYMVRPASPADVRAAMQNEPHAYQHDGRPGIDGLCGVCDLKERADVHRAQWKCVDCGYTDSERSLICPNCATDGELMGGTDVD